MKNYIDTYANIINESDETTFNKSTELLDDMSLVNESLGKWAKNVFTKFGKNSVNNELQKTFNNVIAQFQFKPVKQNGKTNINLLGKKEGDYIILLDLDPANDNFKSMQIGITVLELESKKPIDGINQKLIKMRHSWTEEELVNEIDKVLSPLRIKLTGSAGNINNVLGNSEQTDSQDTLKGHDENVEDRSYAGFKTSEIQEALNKAKGSKEQKMSKLKSLISGWKKLADNERKAFLSLK